MFSSASRRGTKPSGGRGADDGNRHLPLEISAWLIPQEIGRVGEPGIKEGPDVALDVQVIHRRGHARQPLVPRGLPDREVGMPHAQPRVPVLLDVEVWATQPA